MAIEACRQISMIKPSTFLPHNSDVVLQYRLREVSISWALAVPETDEGVEVSLSMRCNSQDTWHEFRIFSYTLDGGWVENCRGLTSVSSKPTGDDQLSTICLPEWTGARINDALSMDAEAFYGGVNDLGLT